MPEPEASGVTLKKFLLVTVIVVSGCGIGLTEDDPMRPRSAPPAMQATRASSVPTLDGDVLNDPAWRNVQPASGFWQTAPVEGAPASEATEVRIVFDDRNLYVGVICYDSEPEEVFASDSRRDVSLDDTDSFRFILDTFRDRQNGVVFGTNPAGMEYDGQLTRRGAGSGLESGGATGGFNLNWDGAWEVRTSIHDEGWSAEFVIPFRTLRYGLGAEQEWGINFQRNIRRKNERVFWAPLSHQFNLHRVQLAGTVGGVEPPKQRNLKVTPYGLGKVRDLESDADLNWAGEIGADAKYNVTGGLTLDATYNTDFAQVEADIQQINLDRFNLFFPEKRPFFLENAGFFSVGNPGQTALFFSRRIGISPRGAAIPIYGGGRLSGKVGSFTNVGLLMMQTESFEPEGIPSNNFAVARVSREFPNRSSIGGIVTNRQGFGSLAGDQDYNRTFALDGNLGVGEYANVSGFVAKSFTPALNGDDHAFRVAAEYNKPSWRLSGYYGEVADNFNPEAGFLRRSDFREIGAGIFFRLRHVLGLQEMRPHTWYQGYWNFDGFHETGKWHNDIHWEFRNGAQIHTGVNVTREGVLDQFPIWADPKNPTDVVEVAPGTYDHIELGLSGFTNRGAPLSLGFRLTAGGFFGGDRFLFGPSARWRFGQRFNGEVQLSRNSIDLPGGDFVANLARFRLNYSFTPRISLRALVQYNNRSGTWSSNVRFSWLQAANTGLFIVYNDTRGEPGVDFLSDRALIVKFSRMFDLLN